VWFGVIDEYRGIVFGKVSDGSPVDQVRGQLLTHIYSKKPYLSVIRDWRNTIVSRTMAKRLYKRLAGLAGVVSAWCDDISKR